MNKLFASQSFRFVLGAIVLQPILVASTLGALTTGSEKVTGSREVKPYKYGNNQMSNGFKWDYNYTRSFDGTSLNKTLSIEFKFDDALGWDDTKKAQFKTDAATNIAAIWNNKATITDDDTMTVYPITVTIKTDKDFNQTVKVDKGDGDESMLLWYADWIPSVQAHEVGHMFSLFDEYEGGAVEDPASPTLSDDGLMGLGARNDKPVMYDRYYQQYLDYIKILNPKGKFTLAVAGVMIPEPASLILLATGLCALSAIRRRSRSARLLSSTSRVALLSDGAKDHSPE